MPLAEKLDIDALVEQKDVDGLIEVFCRAEDGDLRLQAARAVTRILSDILDRARARALDLDRAHDLVRTLGLTRSLVLTLTDTRAFADALELGLNPTPTRHLALSRALYVVLSLTRSLADACEAPDLTDTRALDFTRNLDPAYIRALADALGLTHTLILAPVLGRIIAKPVTGIAAKPGPSGLAAGPEIAAGVGIRVGDRQTTVRLLVVLGNQFARLGEVDLAIEHYEEALNESADILEEEQAQKVQTRLESLKEYRRSASYLTSIKHPRRLSKRLSSKFKIFIYPSEDRTEVEKVLREAFDDENWTGSVHPSGVETGDLVVLKLWSAEIEFSGEVVKRIEHTVNSVTIGAKPKDTCHPGDHTVTLSICKKDTGEEINSIDFTVHIVDFAFDHVSRPLLSNVVSGVSGVFGAVAFVVTLFTDIDKALGLTAGTAALAVAAFIQARAWQLFRRPSTTVTPYPP